METETLTLTPQAGFTSDMSQKLEDASPEHDERMVIPQSVYDQLPEPLGSLCGFFAEGSERDVFLTGALVVCSGILSRVLFCQRDKRYHLNLFALVTAPPSSGKGEAGLAWRLGSSIDERLRSESRAAIAEWEASAKENEAIESRNSRKGKNVAPELTSDIGPRPPFRTLSVAVNSSSRAFIDRLHENEGEGVLFESETLTFLNANKQDWGNALEIYLKGYHNEEIAIDRRGGESLRITDPCFGTFLSGTPNATKRMFSKGAEDGLFSRFMHYTFEGLPVWRSHAPGPHSQARENLLNDAAAAMDRLHLMLNGLAEPLLVVLSDEQWRVVDSSFGGAMEALERSGADRLLLASVKRAALNAERIACILTVLRQFESGTHLQDAPTIQPTDEDISSATAIASTYLAHALEVAKTLPVPVAADLSGSELMVWSVVPEEPEKTSSQNIAALTTFNIRKVQRNLEKLRQKGLIITHAERGPYSRPKFIETSRVACVALDGQDRVKPTETTHATDATLDTFGEPAF